MNYKKLKPIDHCLLRPDTYIGTVQTQYKSQFIYNQENDSIENKQCYVNDGIIRLFVETLSNAIDNYFRSLDGPTPMTKLVVQYNSESNVLSFLNDGNHIPLIQSEEEKMPIPQMIFGELMSGSNYNDKEERTTSGRNGLGIKLCNIFSTEFEINCFDPNSKQLYKQKWKNNMKKCGNPRILEKDGNTGYTKVMYKIDMTRFYNEEKISYCENEMYDIDTLNHFQKLLIDASMIMGGLPVFWNKKRFQFKKDGILEYCKYFSFYTKECISGHFGPKKEIDYCIIASNNSNDNLISFVNGIYTSENGYHMDAIINKLFPAIANKLKKYNVTSKDLKQYFSIVIRVNCKNPTFSSQTKNKLISCKENLVKLVEFEEKQISKILKFSFVETIKNNFKLKEELNLIKNTEKKRGYRSISGYDKANFSGTKKSSECSLILCEGLSAKTFATKGLASKGINGKKGRNYIGIYPLRGKCINVRNASISSISNNREFKDLLHCLNLRYNTDYTQEKNFQSLHYGQVIILTDSDYDGMHICGLILNIFQFLFPSLFDREEPFIKYMLTPVSKVKVGTEHKTFYNDYQYKQELEELEESKEKYEVRYYKGLGSSTDIDIKQSFGEKVVSFRKDEETDKMIDMVFNKNLSDQRKDWLLTIDERNYTVPENEYDISLFLNQDFIRFSVDDCKRSLPSIYDGLKVSQRKILYAVFKKSLNFKSKPMKVAQLGSYTAEITQYHHGESCLMDTIIKMGCNYTGSNNINILDPVGQFGSRVQNSKDAASPRYIHTKMGPLTDKIFSCHDENLYEYAFEDGSKVEPLYYLPIIPLILCNGTRSIGTGWSSFIPNFKFEDIIKKIKCLLEDREDEFEEYQLKPYYNGFLGEIEEVSHNKFITKGILECKDTNNKRIYIVKEIPIGESIDGYKEYLEKKQEDKHIKNFKNYSSAEKIHFEFELGEKQKSVTLENFKLTSLLSLNNMVLFVKNDKIMKFGNVDSIIRAFFSERLKMYNLRREYLLETIKEQIKILENKMRFILEVLEKKTIQLFNIAEEDIYNNLTAKEYYKVDNSYDYLLSLPIRSMGREKYNKLSNQLEKYVADLEILTNTNGKEMWMKELSILFTEYQKHFS